MKQFVNTYSGEDASAADQFGRLQEILGGQTDIPVHNAAPAKPRIGRVVVADGTNWDPLTVGVPRLVWFNGNNWVALNA